MAYKHSFQPIRLASKQNKTKSTNIRAIYYLAMMMVMVRADNIKASA